MRFRYLAIKNPKSTRVLDRKSDQSPCCTCLEFLKAKNEMLRPKVPKQFPTTPAERRRLTRTMRVRWITADRFPVSSISQARHRPVAVQAPCAHEAFSEEVVVNKPDGKSGGTEMGRLVNAVVMISDIKKGKPLGTEAPVPLDQKGCVFTPHVVWAPAGGKLKILNSDNAAHNVHSKSDLNTEFNAALAPKGETHAKFDEAERIKVRCDMHNWMTVWIVVAENPYTIVTGEDGSFKMDKVPPGSYTVTVWQETLGEQKAQVTVKSGEDSKLEITYK